MNRAAASRFAGLLRTHARRHAVESFLLLLALAATEGAGLFVLVPLLAAAGVVPASGGDGLLAGLARWLPHSLALLLAAYVALVALRALVDARATAVSARVEAEITTALRKQLYDALAVARWDSVVGLRSSRLAHVLTVEIDRVSLAANQLLGAATEVVVVLVYGISALILAPVLTLLSAVIVFMLQLVVQRQRRAATDDGEAITAMGAELFAGGLPELGMLRAARSMGASEFLASRFTTAATRYAAALVRAHRRYAYAGAMLTAGAAAALALVVWLAVTRAHLAPARILLLLFIAARLLPRVSSVQGKLLAALRAMPAANAVAALQRELEEAASPPARDERALAAPRVAITLRDVRYRYPGAANDALTDVSIGIPAHSVTAIVGPSGAGKSTLADVVLQLLAPQSGDVLVDGAPLTPDVRRSWQRMIGYVPQDVHLIHGSIAENLRWASASAGENEMREALDVAGAGPLLARLPHGLETIVGDRGALLSGGERQRIALARALLRRPALLVLDEAMNALDVASEAAVRDAISALAPPVTVVSITHRLASAALANHVVVLDGGRVVAEGPWEDVSAVVGGLAGPLGVLEPAGGVPGDAIRSSTGTGRSHP